MTELQWSLIQNPLTMLETVFDSKYAWLDGCNSIRNSLLSFDGMDSHHNVVGLIRQAMGNGKSAVLADWIRCVFGDLFNSLPSHNSSWRRNRDVMAIAQALLDPFRAATETSPYVDPAQLSILADAMEDAGCDQPRMLMHLRGMRPCHTIWDADGNLGDPDSHRFAGCTLCHGTGWIKSSDQHLPGCHVLRAITSPIIRTERLLA